MTLDRRLALTQTVGRRLVVLVAGRTVLGPAARLAREAALRVEAELGARVARGRTLQTLVDVWGEKQQAVSEQERGSLRGLTPAGISMGSGYVKTLQWRTPALVVRVSYAPYACREILTG